MIEVFTAVEADSEKELSLEAAIELSQSSAGPVWINIRDPEADEVDRVGKALKIHELNLEDIRHASSFPKCDNHEHYRFATLLSPRTAVPREGKFAQRELDFIVCNNLVITVQLEELQGIQRLRDRLSSDRSLLERAVGFPVHFLIDVLVDRYLTAAESIAERCEELYSKVWESAGELALFDEILDLQYSCRTLLLVSERSRSVIREFRWGEGANVFDAESEVYFSDLVDHLNRVEDILCAVTERLQGASNLFRAKEAGRRDGSLQQIAGIGYGILLFQLLALGFVLSYSLEQFSQRGLQLALGFVVVGFILTVLFFVRRLFDRD